MLTFCLWTHLVFPSRIRRRSVLVTSAAVSTISGAISSHSRSHHRDKKVSTSEPRQQRSHHATGGDVGGDEHETAFDYGDDFNSDDDDDDGSRDGNHDDILEDELSRCDDASVGVGGGNDGDGDGEKETDDLDAELRMALMSTPSDVSSHRPSQCEAFYCFSCCSSNRLEASYGIDHMSDDLPAHG